MHYATALNASKKENVTNYRFEIFYAWAIIVTLQSVKTTVLAWHYFWREEIKSNTFWTDLVDCDYAFEILVESKLSEVFYQIF